jgi:uncharacterized protein involved in exopolysaccharide biosynthesis
MLKTSDRVAGKEARQFRDLIDFQTIARSVWRQKKVLFAATGACCLLAVLYLHTAHYLYTVSLQVTPVADQIKQENGNLSDLANAAGIALPGGSSQVNAFELFLQGLYTRDTATKLARDQGLMRKLYWREWDVGAHQWHDPAGLLHRIVSVLKGALGIPVNSWRQPDGERVQDFIVRNVRVSRDLKNPAVTIGMDYDDPTVAMEFLDKLRKADDDQLRARALDRTSKYIEYLNSEINKVTFDEYRKALTDLLADQEKRRMFASSASISYAAEPFQTPSTSTMPTKPNALFVLILSVFIGVLFGGFAAFFWDNWSGRTQAALRTD